MSKEDDLVRISCQSTDFSVFCLDVLDKGGKPVGGIVGRALDRCKGVGCKGQPCATQFLVTRMKAEELKKIHPEIIIV